MKGMGYSIHVAIADRYCDGNTGYPPKMHPTLIPNKSGSTKWTRILLIHVSLFTADVSTYACKVLAQNKENNFEILLLI